MQSNGPSIISLYEDPPYFSSMSASPSLQTPRANGADDESSLICKDPDPQTREIFLPYRVFCTRKDIQCKDVILEDVDVAKALIEYASHTAIEHLVLGASTKTGLLRYVYTSCTLRQMPIIMNVETMLAINLPALTLSPMNRIRNNII